MYPNQPADPTQLPPRPDNDGQPPFQPPAGQQPFAPSEPLSQSSMPPAGEPSQLPASAPVPAYNDFSQQPMAASPPPRRRNARKTAGIVVIAIIVLAVGGVGAYAMMQKPSSSGSLTVGGITPTATSDNGSTSPTAKDSATDASADVSTRTDGKLDLTKLIDPANTIKSQNLTATVNQQINMSDGHSYMVTSVTRNATAATGTLSHPPLAGKEYIKVNLVIGNRAQKDTYSFIDGHYKIKDSTGQLVLPQPISAADVPDILQTQDIAPGKQIAGSIVYLIGKDEKVSLVTSETYSLTGGTQGTAKATITSEVTF